MLLHHLGCLAVMAVGCADHGQSPELDPRMCVVTQTVDRTDERFESQMEEPGRPSATRWLRDGVVRSSWTYAYDDAGRLVMQEQDWGGGPLDGPDGVPDQHVTIQHAPRLAISTRRNVNSSDSQTLTYTLDADDHVTRLDSSTSTATYQLGSGGRIEREDLAAIDIDSGPYTRVTEHTFDAEGRPSTRRIDDSRGPSGSFGWQYEVSPGRLVVEVTREATTHSRYIYSYDASDRPIKAENDSDGDGTTDWSVEIAYADDGAVTTRMFPSDAASSVHTFSSGCNYAIEAPQLPRARSRPGPEWQFLIPSMPDAYE